MIEKQVRRSFRKSQGTAPLFLEYFYKLHTRVVLYLSYAVGAKDPLTPLIPDRFAPAGVRHRHAARSAQRSENRNVSSD